MQTVTRAQFDAFRVEERQAFLEAGGTVHEAPVLNKLSRKEFVLLNPSEKMAFVQRGGVVEEPPVAPQTIVTDSAVLTRSEFSRLSPIDQLKAARNGTRIVDGQRAAPAVED
jgi:hypothetical protein